MSLLKVPLDNILLILWLTFFIIRYQEICLLKLPILERFYYNLVFKITYVLSMQKVLFGLKEVFDDESG